MSNQMSQTTPIKVHVTTAKDRQALNFKAVFPPTDGDWTVQLPCWRPGRYEIANFAQYILRMEGNLDGNTVRLCKSTLHSWTVPAGISEISWTFQADILNAGSTFVRDDIQYANPVNCMLYAIGREELPYEIHLADIPKDWTIATGLPFSDRILKAENMQHIMDNPWVAAKKLWHGEYKIQDEEKEIDFHVWSYGCEPPQKEKFMEAHETFSRSQIEYFKTFPTPSYHFLYLLPKDITVRHGVEHEWSTVIALGPEEISHSDYGYEELLSIGSHELYHCWNVKRIRPADWTPYDFTGACPSQLGYIAEGVTTYMGDLFLFESGCIDLNGWCKRMGTLLSRHINNPGRLNYSVAESSFDTWLDGYKPGVHGRKGSIYVEGALLAFLCDCRIMKATNMNSSLSTAMTLLWERFGKERKGLREDNYWDTLAEIAGERLDDLREDYAHGTKDSWEDLVEGMKLNGLILSKSKNKKGVYEVKLVQAPTA